MTVEVLLVAVAIVPWFYALPSGSTYLVVLDALVLVVSTVTVWALVSNRPRLAQTLLGATVLLALPAAAIWVAVLALIALAILVRTARARRSGERRGGVGGLMPRAPRARR